MFNKYLQWCSWKYNSSEKVHKSNTHVYTEQRTENIYPQFDFKIKMGANAILTGCPPHGAWISFPNRIPNIIDKNLPPE